MNTQRVEIPEGHTVVSREELVRLRHVENLITLASPIVQGMVPSDVFGGMTCTEAQALANIFSAGRQPETAEFIMGQHALGDDDPEDTHHAEFLTARQEGRA